MFAVSKKQNNMKTNLKTRTANQIASQLEKQAELIREMAKGYRNRKLSGPAYRYMLANRALALEAITERIKHYRDEELKAIIF